MAKAAATATSTSSDWARSPATESSPSPLSLRTMHTSATSGNANRNPWLTTSDNELTQRNRK